jgi:mycothiol synthase
VVDTLRRRRPVAAVVAREILVTDPLPLAPGYRIRHPRPDEAPAVHALIVATETAEFGEATGYSLAELEADWRTNDPATDAWVGVAPDGALAAYGSSQHRRHARIDAEGYVHPDHEGRGLGTALVRLTEARAREHLPLAPAGAQVVAQHWINARNANARAVLEREGYAPVRYFWRMEVALDRTPPAVGFPDGIVVRAAAGGADEEAAHRVMNESFADHWGYIPQAFDEWIERRRNHGIEHDLWFLAFEGGEPAAGALCSVSDGAGWVDTLGVRRAWRGRGLGKALLHHAFAAFRERGLARALLGVDAANPTGATGLYERVGMRPTQEHAVYRKELRPGKELADLDGGEASAVAGANT